MGYLVNTRAISKEITLTTFLESDVIVVASVRHH